MGDRWSLLYEAQKWFGCDERYTLAVQFIELVGQESVQHLRRPVFYHRGAQGDLIEEEL